ncbi:hypothetical protein CsSME_00039652 [Camellia sinensis var. sinensis]
MTERKVSDSWRRQLLFSSQKKGFYVLGDWKGETLAAFIFSPNVDMILARQQEMQVQESDLLVSCAICFLVLTNARYQ